jgi:hypothetical protein
LCRTVPSRGRLSVSPEEKGGPMATQDEAELQRLLQERLQLVDSDPEYEGAEPTSGDQLLLAVVGLVIPAILMIGGWVLYGG